MPSTVLGKVTCTPRGSYSADTDYSVLDIVAYNGGSHMALKDVSGITPNNDGVNWMQLAAPGQDGEDGAQGPTGAAAGFGTPTITVDESTGTPQASVTASGPNTAKIFAFTFSGLKGEQGPQGSKGDTGAQGAPGTSVESISRTSGTGAPGTTDTYTMYSSDGSTIGTFTVYNGSNGTGSGDFMADGSVPMSGNLQMGNHKITGLAAPTAATDAVRQQDLEAVSDEVDKILDGTTPVAIPAATTVKIGGVIVGEGLEVDGSGTLSVDTDTAPTQGSTNPIQSGGVYSALNSKLDSPGGGTEGQILTKTADGEAWQDAPSGLPEGGTDGQILTKTASGAAWEDAPNEVSTATDTSITGLLKGANGKVAQAVEGTDYEAAGTAANAVSTHNTAGDAHSTLFAGKAEVSIYNATLTTTYAEDSNGYQAQTVNVSGLLATDTPTIDCVLSGTDKDADTAVLQAFSLINRATTGAGTLTVQCIGDAPTVAIPITLQVVR